MILTIHSNMVRNSLFAQSLRPLCPPSLWSVAVQVAASSSHAKEMNRSRNQLLETIVPLRSRSFARNQNLLGYWESTDACTWSFSGLFSSCPDLTLGLVRLLHKRVWSW